MAITGFPRVEGNVLDSGVKTVKDCRPGSPYGAHIFRLSRAAAETELACKGAFRFAARPFIALACVAALAGCSEDDVSNRDTSLPDAADTTMSDAADTPLSNAADTASPDASDSLELDGATDTGPDTDTTETADAHRVPNADTDGGAEDPPGDGLDYTDPALWLCHPDLPASEDICRGTPIDVTEVEADGTAIVRVIERADAPFFDCFYVYPTVSADRGPVSDLERDAEVGVTILQAARYGEVCEVFAPLYRQVTVTGLLAASTTSPELLDAAYADVLDAFQQFRAERPDRPFLLVGHSQGSGHLTRLIQDEIETSPELSERLIAAHLLGPFPSIVVPWNPDTGEIEPVGGTFSNTPLCESADQTGCVVTFSSFRETDPPGLASFFAVPDPDATPPLIGACTHPAALAGGEASLSDGWLNGAYFETESDNALTEFGPYVDPESNEALTTAHFAMPGLLSGVCEIQNGYHVLSVAIDADPSDPRVDDIVGDVLPGWGLHLGDVSIVLDDLVSLAKSQSMAWAGANRP